ncbi:hypothetical protein SCHPADRAFT_998146 [Schizopora paradoxa]|uniref:NACHT domain-containing protein n=1 Tax=Schizopora paradoxa TaxID=27342 RepID=A0A0H2RSF5_9AGAM|nr:hypothetical protein SCHPADRAFT_998146 [Schizopora paradoxa]
MKFRDLICCSCTSSDDSDVGRSVPPNLVSQLHSCEEHDLKRKEVSNANTFSRKDDSPTPNESDRTSLLDLHPIHPSPHGDDPIPTPLESNQDSKARTPSQAKTSDYSSLIDTADSIVDFVLKGIENVGSGLPGIGAVSVVLAAKDKFMIDRENRKEMDKILKYIEELCRDVGSADGNGTADIGPLNASFITDLRQELSRIKKTDGWRHALDVLKAETRRDELTAIWEGIQRAMDRHKLKVWVKVDEMLDRAFKILNEDHETLKDVRKDQLAEMTKEEQRRMNEVLNRLRTAEGARFDSMRTSQTRMRPCTTRTRIGVLDTIKDWAMSTGEDREHIFWLNGLAGTGKSTIATTVADWAREQKILGANFFFARDVAELNTPARVFPTLAFQLAQFDERYKRALFKALEEDKDVQSAKLEVQFDKLIRTPFEACLGERAILVMLDALDECSSEADVKDMLQVLLRCGSIGKAGGPRIRIFVTSRPEAHIRFMFKRVGVKNSHEKVVLHEMDDSIARNDIQTFLQDEFAKITSGTYDLPPTLSDWPGREEFDALLASCGKFFAYAATSIRFIADERIRDPVGQLEDILDIKDRQFASPSTNPYIVLDSLYLGVLKRALANNGQELYTHRVRCVLATILCLRRPMSTLQLAEFLLTSDENIRSALHFLHSVLLVPEGSFEEVRFFHPSFPDFLRDKDRCTDKSFIIDIPVHHDFMASRCMESIVLSGCIECFSLTYSAQHWIAHMLTGYGTDSFDWHYKWPIWPIVDSLAEGLKGMESNPPLDSWVWSNGTRERVLKAVGSWALDTENNQPHTFWMHGWAYKGYPSIALFITKWARDEGILGAAFTFSYTSYKKAGEHNETIVRTILPTLACQLARLDARYKLALCQEFSGGIRILSAELDKQFEKLIRLPLLACEGHRERPLLILLDAVDFIYFDESLRQVMHLLQSLPSELSGGGGTKLRILVISTPDHYVSSLLKPEGGATYRSKDNIASLDFDESFGRDDLQSYLKLKIPLVYETNPTFFNDVVDLCGSSYTYAALIARMLNDEEFSSSTWTSIPCFSDFLEDRHRTVSRDTDPSIELDELYRYILLRASQHYCSQEDLEIFRSVTVTILCLRREGRRLSSLLSVGELADFLLVTTEAVDGVLNTLRVVLDAEDLRIPFHPSFASFIQDKTRCTDERFVVNVSVHERFMALRCLKCIRYPPIEWSGTKNYATSHWPSHVRAATLHDFPNDLIQELIWLVGDTEALVKSYRGHSEVGIIAAGNDQDILHFLRSLMVKYKPKESELIFRLLDGAEDNGNVSRARQDYLCMKNGYLK